MRCVLWHIPALVRARGWDPGAGAINVLARAALAQPLQLPISGTCAVMRMACCRFGRSVRCVCVCLLRMCQRGIRQLAHTHKLNPATALLTNDGASG